MKYNGLPCPVCGRIMTDDDDIVVCRGHDAVARLVNFVQSVFEFGIFGFSFLQKPYVTHKREINGALRK